MCIGYNAVKHFGCVFLGYCKHLYVFFSVLVLRFLVDLQSLNQLYKAYWMMKTLKFSLRASYIIKVDNRSVMAIQFS